MLAKRTFSAATSKRDRDRFTRTSGPPVKQNSDTRQLGERKRRLLHVGGNLFLPLWRSRSRFPSFVKPRLSLAIPGLECTQICFAQHSTDSCQHWPHISTAIATQINEPAVRLLGL